MTISWDTTSDYWLNCAPFNSTLCVSYKKHDASLEIATADERIDNTSS